MKISKALLKSMCWDGSYDWSVGTEEYRLLKKDRQMRFGGELEGAVGIHPLW